MDILGIFGVVAELFAQPLDVDSKRRHVGVAVGAPHSVEQSLLRDNLLGVLKKVDQDLEFLASDLHELVTLMNRHGIKIHTQIFVFNDLIIFS